MRADAYPAGEPRQTYTYRAQVVRDPRFAGDNRPTLDNTTTHQSKLIFSAKKFSLHLRVFYQFTNIVHI